MIQILQDYFFHVNRGMLEHLAFATTFILDQGNQADATIAQDGQLSGLFRQATPSLGKRDLQEQITGKSKMTSRTNDPWLAWRPFLPHDIDHLESFQC